MATRDLDRHRKLIGSAAIIFDQLGRVLLVKHTYGRLNWEVPGGAAELNESIGDTAVREVKEETGLCVVVERLTGVYYEASWQGHEMIHFAFRCRLEDSSSVPTPSDAEIDACDYFQIDGLPRPISDFTIRRIEDARSGSIVMPVIVGQRQWLM